MDDSTIFPDPVYRDTVLSPLFEGAKTHYVDAFRAINQAHLIMLAEQDILDRQQAKAIAGSLRDIDVETDTEALTYTGEHEDYFFLVEAELRRRLGGDLGGALHTARSRNDMDHTVFKIVLRAKVDAFLKLAQDLATRLLDTATRESGTLIVAYTHGQPAQPTTFGHYLHAVVDVLLRDIARLSTARDMLDHCPMGSAAITTTGFPIDRQQVAELLGFTDPTANSYGAIAAVDYVTGTYSALKLMCLHLGRVVQDLQFWTAFEVGQLYVPNALVQISSIMPQKRNPVPIEHMRHLASVAVGRADMVINTMHNTPFTDMNDSEGEVQVAGYGAFESAGRMVALLATLIPACRVRSDRVAANMDAACVTITELADTLVRDEGLSFRQAHEIAAATAKDVIARGVPLGEGYSAFFAAFKAAVSRDTNVDEAQFADAVHPQTFVNRREIPGGPGPNALAAALQAARADHADLSQKTARRIDRISAADASRHTAFSRLLET